MTEVVSIAEARARPGVRIVSIPGVPSPWTEAAKGLLYVKGVPYVLARPGADEAPDAAARMYARDLSGHFPMREPSLGTTSHVLGPWGHGPLPVPTGQPTG